MESDAIDRMMNLSRSLFYTDFLLFFCEVTAIVATLFFLRKEKMTYLFIIYCWIALLHLLSSKVSFFFYLQKESPTAFIEATNIFFAIIEYSVFYHFFEKALNSSIVKKIMLSFYALLLVAFIIFLYKLFFVYMADIVIYKIADYIISSELLFLFFLCVVYYFELFREKPVINLLQSPSFWIVTALFFYSAIIIPFFIITSDDFRNINAKIYNALFAVHYTLFGLLFLAITKAFLCKRPLTT